MISPSDHVPGTSGKEESVAAGAVRIRHRVLEAGGWAMAGFVLEKGIGFL